MTGHSGKQSWFSETWIALGLLLKAALQSIAFTVFGGLLAPIVLLGMLIGKFPNAFSAVYSAIIILPLLALFPFNALIALSLSLMGIYPNYRKGVYGAAHWIDEVKLSDPTIKRKKGKWPLTVKLTPFLSMLLFFGIIIALPHQSVDVSKMSFEERFVWEAEKIDYLFTYISDDRHRRMVIALKHKWTKAAKDLIENGYDKKQAFRKAAYWGNYEIVEHLVETPEISVRNVNVLASVDEALQSASGKGYLDIVRLLLEHRAKKNFKGTGYRGALNRAASGGFADCVQLLINYGAKTNPGNKFGNTPLLYATKASNEVQDEDRLIKTIGILLSNGADVNARSESGSTPLHFIAQTPKHTKYSIFRSGTMVVYPPRIKCAQLLLDHGANVRNMDKKGKTPLDYAEDEKMRELLENYTPEVKN